MSLPVVVYDMIVFICCSECENTVNCEATFDFGFKEEMKMLMKMATMTMGKLTVFGVLGITANWQRSNPS